ncbi:MAG: hypothetical protein WCX83_04935 [Candidatus Cloacimonas sp.]
MSKRKVALTLICEDTQQECFVRRFLNGMGWGKRQLRIEKSPSGRGSGEQWVREKYAAELANYRKSHVQYAILTIVDGDVHGVSYRTNQFDNKCIEKEIPVRNNLETVAIIVPTRNIETWIKYLEGEKVDETTIYPKLNNESDCKPAVDRLLNFYKGIGLPKDAPQSLNAARNEFRSRIRR